MSETRVKIVTFVPNEKADEVREALGKAGAGILGEYSFCSFSSAGIGRFKPSSKANPHIGEKNEINTVMEHRIEVTCLQKEAKQIIAALKKAHPYEEVALDIYPLMEESEL
jgi:hypothetical protein